MAPTIREGPPFDPPPMKIIVGPFRLFHEGPHFDPSQMKIIVGPYRPPS